MVVRGAPDVAGDAIGDAKRSGRAEAYGMPFPKNPLASTAVGGYCLAASSPSSTEGRLVDDDLVLQLGGRSDRRSIPLSTRTGNHIPNVRRLERPPDSLRAAIGIWARERPDAILRTISNTYNCVGLVFASRRTHVDVEHLPQIYREDDYRSVDSPELGDVAVYRANGAIQHVGIVIGVEVDFATGRRSITVLSKWGGDGEYVHDADYVPAELGRIVEYWTDRLEGLNDYR